MKQLYLDKSACVNTLCRIRYKCLRYNGVSKEHRLFSNFISECYDPNFKHYIEMEE